MKDYHYECMIIILSHLVAETGELINELKNKEKYNEGELWEYINHKLGELDDILSEIEEVWGK